MRSPEAPRASEDRSGCRGDCARRGILNKHFSNCHHKSELKTVKRKSGLTAAWKVTVSRSVGRAPATAATYARQSPAEARTEHHRPAGISHLDTALARRAAEHRTEESR